MLCAGNCQRGGGYYGGYVFFNDYSFHNSSFFPIELGETYSKNSFCVLSSVYPIGKDEEERNNNNEIYNNIIQYYTLYILSYVLYTFFINYSNI